MSKWIAGVCALFMLATASSASAALQPYQRVGSLFDQVFDSGVGDGTTFHQQRAALNYASGRLYLADDVGDQVRVFDPTATGATEGTPFGAGEMSDPLGVAVDQSTGDVYVSDDDEVLKYDSAGDLDAGFSSGVTGPIAFDQANDELVVADIAANVIRHYTPAGSAVGAPFDGSDVFDGAAPFAGLQDVAVTSDGGVVVVDSDGDPALGTGTSRVERYSATGAHEATFGPVAGAATVAVAPATGEVLVSGNQDGVNRDEPPTLTVFDGDVPGVPGEQVAIDASMKWATIRGLAVDDGPNARLYVVGDVSELYAGGYGNITVEVYERPTPVAPTVKTTAPSEVSDGGARLQGTINPGGFATTYWFEYGTTTSYGTDVPVAHDADAGSDTTSVGVSRLVGLDAGKSYHYRLVATNAGGTTYGLDRQFTTRTGMREPPPVDTCANATIRGQQRSSYLADCRAYEMVSPPDKNDTDIFFSTNSGMVSGDGNAASYASPGAFAGSVMSTGILQYLSRRQADGWSTESLYPRFDQNAALQGTSILGATDSLDRTLIRASDPPLTAGVAPESLNIFARDTATGAFSLLTPPGPTGFAARRASLNFAAASDDFSHVVIESSYPVTSDAPDPSSAGDPNYPVNVYESVGGQMRLVSILPSGQPAPQGGYAGPGKVGPFSGGAYVGAGNYLEHAVSDDGLRIFWTDASDGQLYVRENGTSTEHVSASQRSAADPDGPLPATWLDATSDGARAFFTSGEKLTDDSAASVDPDRVLPATADLYRYDVASHALEDLSVDAYAGDGTQQADVQGVLGTSDDGNRVYFAAKGILTQAARDVRAAVPAAQPLVFIYLWDHGTLKYVADLADDSPIESRAYVLGTKIGGGKRNARVTPDGEHLLFTSQREQTDQPAGGVRQVYLYNATDAATTCVSCRPDGTSPTHEAVIESAQAAQQFLRPLVNRVMAPDGQRVFFETAEPLVAQDDNGKIDVYQWERGAVSLVSSGHDDDNSHFLDASENGDDVFVVTSQRLVASDTDNNADVYDARVGGGFIEPPPETAPAPCSEGACQGRPSPQPGQVTLGSVTFSGSGDAVAPTRAGRLAVAKLKTVKGTSALLKVKLPARGKVTLSGSGLKTASRSTAKTATVTIRVALTARARATLKRRHRLKLTGRLVYQPATGSSSTAHVSVTFTKPAQSKKKGRS